MTVLLEIKDSKAAPLMEVLGGLKYVKVKSVNPEKELLKQEIAEAVQELILIRQGKKKARNAKEFLNEL